MMPLKQLLAQQSLSAEDTERLFGRIVRGDMDDVELTAILIALKMKGESPAEILGAARALRQAALPFERPDGLFADTAGTGGDGVGTLNISTAVAFCAAGAGLPIAKHGNRSISSKCGSADVLEALGAAIDVSPQKSREALDEAGICFLYAPQYHPGLKHAAHVRRSLATRTMMNVLGPLVNPAEPKAQIVGTYDAALLQPMAEVLIDLGVENALVVHGNGLDEIALHASTQAVRVRDGSTEELTIRPEDAGLMTAPQEALIGGEPEENAAWLASVLGGGGTVPQQHAVALNAGALLWVAGLEPDLKAGAKRAQESLRGPAAEALARFIAVTSRGQNV